MLINFFFQFYLQISNDFENRYGIDFNEEWGDLTDQLHKVLKENTKNTVFKASIDKYAELNDNSKLYATIYGLHAFLYGSTTKKETNQMKVSISQSVTYMVIISPTVESMNDTIDHHQKSLKQRKEAFQPLIVCFGEMWNIEDDCVLVIQNNYFKFNSLLKALEISLKSIMIFDLQLPSANKNVFQFLLQKLFGIEDKRDGKLNSMVTSLLSLLPK
jgi:excinuclease UvrABC ATPase subunit